MSQSTGLKGIIAAAVTPIDAQERFAPGPFQALLERLYAAGTHGVYVCGQTGEGLLQSVDQRKRVAEAAMRHSPPDKQVIVHVGANATGDAMELARHASQLGVAAVSSLPPLGPYRFAEIRGYYEDLAAASSVPLLVYYFPEVCPTIQTAEQMLDLCSIPNVVGLKYTDFDLYRMRVILGTGATVFNGRDEILVAGLLMGAGGGIGTFYNILPELFVEVYDRTNWGDWDGARAAQDRINAIIQVALRFPLFPAIKQILRWTGIDCGECIRPRARLSPTQAADLRQQLDACDFPLDLAASRT